MNNEKVLGLGLVGCGDFGKFCLEAFKSMDQVKIVAVADVVESSADRLGKLFGVKSYYESKELIDDPNVKIVHVAAPPSTHHDLAMTAIKAGKHVLCEKPLATSITDGVEILSAAKAAELIVPVNFILRYNQVTDAVKAVIDSGVLGQALAARLNNSATDALLGEDHWFWKKEISGGIFVEHGVHFFDLYRHLLGPGEVISSHTETRPPTNSIEDRVTCTVRHDNGAVVNHYHSFDQIHAMDRTDHRLIFEMGDMRIEGWIPLTLRIDAMVDQAGMDRLIACCPGCEVRTIKTFEGPAAHTAGRGKQYILDRRISLTFTPSTDKGAVYLESTRSLLGDQIAYIHDRNHVRIVSEDNGLAALNFAQTAREMADES